MATSDGAQGTTLTLETVTNWARSNIEWDKVDQYLAERPQDFFVVVPPRRWPIAHQIVYNGKCNNLKRILELCTDQLDIHTKSADNKTLLDVALEKQKKRPQMYEYVERLFLQDQLIRDAQQSNWNAVNTLLNTRPGLVDEKPPYASCFLIHIVVEKGNCELLNNLVDYHQCDISVKNKTGETPLEMAMRLRKFDMCHKLQSKETSHSVSTSDQTQTSTAAVPKEPEILFVPLVTSAPQSTQPQTSSKAIPNECEILSSSPVSCAPQLDSQMSTSSSSSILSNEADRQPASKPVLHEKKSDDDGSSSTLINTSLYNSDSAEDSSKMVQYRTPVSPFSKAHVIMTKSIISAHSTNNSYFSETSSQSSVSPPASPSTTIPSSSPKLVETTLIKILSCPFSHQIYDDPVIAADGVTYERSAIVKWLSERHTSPSTNKPMSTTLQDNTEMKSVIEAIKKLRRL